MIRLSKSAPYVGEYVLLVLELPEFDGSVARVLHPPPDKSSSFLRIAVGSEEFSASSLFSPIVVRGTLQNTRPGRWVLPVSFACTARSNSMQACWRGTVHQSAFFTVGDPAALLVEFWNRIAESERTIAATVRARDTVDVVCSWPIVDVRLQAVDEKRPNKWTWFHGGCSPIPSGGCRWAVPSMTDLTKYANVRRRPATIRVRFVGRREGEIEVRCVSVQIGPADDRVVL